MVDESIESKIEQFLGHFSKQGEEICCVGGNSSRLFQKVLLCGSIDALSNCMQGNKPRYRFVSCVSELGDWRFANHVSLPHLGRQLERVSSALFSDLRIFVKKEIERWCSSWTSTLSISSDPSLEDVRSLCRKEPTWTTEERIGNLPLQHLTHAHLLYYYRNCLFHELREPGYGMEFSDDDEPYYHELASAELDINGQQIFVDSIELVYPLPFFKRIFFNVLGGLRGYLFASGIDPYERYRFGTHWIPELNDSEQN